MPVTSLQKQKNRFSVTPMAAYKPSLALRSKKKSDSKKNF